MAADVLDGCTDKDAKQPREISQGLSRAMYYSDPRDATPRDPELGALVSRTAANIISWHQDD